MSDEGYGRPYLIWLGSVDAQSNGVENHKQATVFALSPELAKQRGALMWGVPAERVNVSVTPQ